MRSPYAGITKISSIGAFIAKMREVKGLNQQELAERAGLSKSYISQIESESVTEGYKEPKTPSAEACMKLAGALGVHPNELLLRSGRSPIDATVVSSELLVPGQPSMEVSQDQIDSTIAQLTQLRQAVAEQLAMLDQSITNMESLKRQ